MTETTAERYLELMGEDRESRLALLACAAALRLNDDAARDAINLVAGSNGHTERQLHRIKRLSCVWTDWNGAWYLAEDVRSALAEKLEREVTPEAYDQLRLLLARKAEEKTASLPRDGQVTAYESRLMHLEVGFQKVLVPEQTAAGVEQLAEVWLNAPAAGRRATAAAVEHLAPEIERRLRAQPPEVVFLRGMAARERGDNATARECFQTVWRKGRPGEIFAIAAHLYGNLISRSNRDISEQAFRDSLWWSNRAYHQGQVWHSLGNLLARDRGRRREAESAYRAGLERLSDPQDRAQVWHSLGNLLAHDRGRRREAEDAYRASLERDGDLQGEAQSWHSLGNLLARDRGRWQEAEDAYRASLERDINPHGQASVYASWANALAKRNNFYDDEQAIEYAQLAQVLDPGGLKTQSVALKAIADVREHQGKLEEAIKALELLKQNDRKLGNNYENQTQNRIDSLHKRLNGSSQ